MQNAHLAIKTENNPTILQIKSEKYLSKCQYNNGT